MIVKTQAELASAIGLSPGRLSKLMVQGLREVCTVDGGFDTDKAKEWHQQRRAANATSPSLRDPELTGADAAEYAKWTVEMRKAKAIIASLNAASLRGRLVDAKLVERMLKERAQEFRRSLLGGARKLAPQLANQDARKIQQILEAWAADVLSTYSRAARLDVAEPLPDEDDDEDGDLDE